MIKHTFKHDGIMPDYCCVQLKSGELCNQRRLSHESESDIQIVAMCDECGEYPSAGRVEIDPYDMISDSPIFTAREYCLNCYNQRLHAALVYLKKRSCKCSSV